MSGLDKSIIYSPVPRIGFAFLTTYIRLLYTTLLVQPKREPKLLSLFFSWNLSIGKEIFSRIYNSSNFTFVCFLFLFFHEFTKKQTSILFLKEFMKLLVSLFFYTKNLRKQYFHHFLSRTYNSSNLPIPFSMKLQLCSDFTFLLGYKKMKMSLFFHEVSDK